MFTEKNIYIYRIQSKGMLGIYLHHPSSTKDLNFDSFYTWNREFKFLWKLMLSTLSSKQESIENAKTVWYIFLDLTDLQIQRESVFFLGKIQMAFEISLVFWIIMKWLEEIIREFYYDLKSTLLIFKWKNWV